MYPDERDNYFQSIKKHFGVSDEASEHHPTKEHRAAHRKFDMETVGDVPKKFYSEKKSNTYANLEAQKTSMHHKRNGNISSFDERFGSVQAGRKVGLRHEATQCTPESFKSQQTSDQKASNPEAEASDKYDLSAKVSSIGQLLQYVLNQVERLVVAEELKIRTTSSKHELPKEAPHAGQSDPRDEVRVLCCHTEDCGQLLLRLEECCKKARFSESLDFSLLSVRQLGGNENTAVGGTPFRENSVEPNDFEFSSRMASGEKSESSFRTLNLNDLNENQGQADTQRTYRLSRSPRKNYAKEEADEKEHLERELDCNDDSCPSPKPINEEPASLSVLALQRHNKQYRCLQDSCDALDKLSTKGSPTDKSSNNSQRTRKSVHSKMSSANLLEINKQQCKLHYEINRAKKLISARSAKRRESEQSQYQKVVEEKSSKFVPNEQLCDKDSQNDDLVIDSMKVANSATEETTPDLPTKPHGEAQAEDLPISYRDVVNSQLILPILRKIHKRYAAQFTQDIDILQDLEKLPEKMVEMYGDIVEKK